MNVPKSEMMFSKLILADIARLSRKESGEENPESPCLRNRHVIQVHHSTKRAARDPAAKDYAHPFDEPGGHRSPI
jgi:hypothetical protein